MGLYDEGDNVALEESTSEPIGKAIASINKKPLKDKENKRMPQNNSKFEFPDWLKQGIIYVVAIILILAIGLFIYLGVQPGYLNASLNPSPSYISDNSSTTKLTVEVKNINDYDLTGSILSVSPVDKLSIAIIPSDAKTIAILGANETREYQFDVSTIGNINPGSYTLLITLKTSEETIEKKVTWEIKTHK